MASTATFAVLLDQKKVLRGWTKAIGPLDTLDLFRFKRAFPLILFHAGSQPEFTRFIDEHVSLSLSYSLLYNHPMTVQRTVRHLFRGS